MLPFSVVNVNFAEEYAVCVEVHAPPEDVAGLPRARLPRVQCVQLPGFLEGNKEGVGPAKGRHPLRVRREGGNASKRSCKEAMLMSEQH